MPALYPPVEPYDHGMLEVSDGHRLYWETCGSPRGKPALVLHGGPGSGSIPTFRRLFDPAAYRVVQFDQRGCGRSTPHAAEPEVDLSTNTTEHLLADIERLRRHLGVERWLVFGGSWGCVLALVYAQRHPERVTELVLTGVATGRRAETDLLTRGLGHYFPEAWARFRAGVPAADRDGDLPTAYARLLASPDPAVRERAARDWCDWERAIDVTAPPEGPSRFDDPVFRLAFARLVTHYWSHGSWLAEGEVLARAGNLRGVPGVLVQGSLDPGNLLGTPWQLAHAWPGSELVLVDEAGHAAGDPGMAEALVAATDRFAERPGSATAGR